MSAAFWFFIVGAVRAVVAGSSMTRTTCSRNVPPTRHTSCSTRQPSDGVIRRQRETRMRVRKVSTSSALIAGVPGCTTAGR